MVTEHKSAKVLAVATAAAGAAVWLAPFATAETAQETIDRLQASGYTVTIDKIGTAPMSACTVTSVRNKQSTTQLMPYPGPGVGNGWRGSILLPQTNQTVSVSLDCSGHGAAH